MRFSFLRGFNFENFKATFARFPLSIVSGAVCSAFMVWTTYNEFIDNPDWVQHVLSASFVGILLFTGLALFAERHRLRSFLTQLLGIPVLAALIFTLPTEFEIFPVRTALLALASLGLVFSGAYLLFREEKGFWRFSVRVWNRAVMSIVTAIIVVLALELALYSIEALFELTLDYRWEEYIPAIFLVFVPNVVFLLGIPSNYKELEKMETPTSFRAFGTYLFVPLLSIYFLILAAYVVKILATQIWPDGFVATPILVFCAIGFAMYSLVYPLLQDKDSRVLRVFSRLFLWSLPVFMVVYLVAFGQRIEQYGVTEMRYLGVALGVLILAWGLYFGWSKRPQLKMIPIGIALVAFLASFGPWGAFQVSEWSQSNRLESLLVSNGLLVEGALVPSSDEVVLITARRDISSSLDYLLSHYGEDSLPAWFGSEEEVKELGASGLMEKMGLSYESYYYWGPEEEGTNYYFSRNDMEPLLVEGYDYSVHFYMYFPPIDSKLPTEDFSFSLESDKNFTVHYDPESTALEVGNGASTLSLPMADFLAGLEAGFGQQDSLNPEDFAISGENAVMSVKVYFTSLSYLLTEDTRENLNLDADLLILLK